MLPGDAQAAVLSQLLSPTDVHAIVFWSTKSLSKDDAKGKLRLFKMVYIPYGNIVLRKHNIFINPVGFGVGASLVYISKTLLAKDICFLCYIYKEQSNDEK